MWESTVSKDSTVKPVLRGHFREKEKKWSYKTGDL